MKRVLKVLSLTLILAGVELSTGALSHAVDQVLRVYFELVLDAEPSVSVRRFFWGVGLIILGLLFVLLELWARASLSGVPRGKHCPQCGGETERVRRRQRHRIMAWILGERLSRRKCKECEWAGLMV